MIVNWINTKPRTLISIYFSQKKRSTIKLTQNYKQLLFVILKNQSIKTYKYNIVSIIKLINDSSDVS